MISLIVEAAVRMLAVALAVWGGLRLLRVSNVWAQKAAWGLVLAAALLMPMLMRWQWLSAAAPIRFTAHTWGLTEKPAQASAPAVAAPTSTLDEALSRPAAASPLKPRHFAAIPAPPAEAVALPAPAPPPATPTALHWTAYLWRIYLVAGALLLARLLYGLIAALWLWSTAEPVSLPPALSALAAGVRLRSSRRIASPVAIASGVVLPADYLQWDAQKLRIVLAHERSHLRQGDFYLQTLASLHAALFWFSPLAWWLKRTLSDLGEALSDRAGLEVAASRSAYAQVLLEFAALPRPALLGVAMASNRSSLARRMERFLNESSFRQAFTGSRPRAILAVLLVPAILFATTALIRVEAASQAAAQSTADQVQPPPPPADLPPPPPPPPAGRDGITISNSGAGFFCASTSSGDWYAVVTDPQTEVKASFNGKAAYLNRELAYARRHAHGRFLWFSHDRKAYIVEDPEMVARMESIVDRNEAIVNSLASSKEAKRLGLRVKDGNLVTGASLGELLGKLGEEGGRVGEEWGKLGSEADTKMKAIIDQSLSNGSAHEAAPPPPPSADMVPPPPPPPPPPGHQGMNANNGPGFFCASSRDGLSFAVITDSKAEDCFTGDNSKALNHEIAKALEKTKGKFLWFSKDGKSFTIDDHALTAQMEGFTRQMETLDFKQDQLGGQQDQLSVQMEKLSSQMAQLSLPTPEISKEMADLDKQMAKLAAEQEKSKNTEEWADLESKKGNLQGKIGELIGQIGAQKGAQGAKMGELGAKMGELGAQLGKLGAQQGALSAEAQARMKAIIDQALKESKAHPVQ